MARHEGDREDLMAEATALVRRAEVVGPGHAEPAVIGFRQDGGVSVYFGADPVYHLDAEGRLKRAFRGGLLYRTQGETLAELTRERTASETVLRRRDLTPGELESFLAEMLSRILSLLVQRKRGALTVVRQVPYPDEAFWPDFEAAVRRMDERTGNDRLAPRFKGKR